MEDYFYINNTNITNSLKRKGSRYDIGEEGYRINVGEKTETVVIKNKNGSETHKKVVTKLETSFIIDRDEGVEPLNSLDFLIIDAVYYILNNYIVYNDEFTVNKLIHVITGSSSGSISQSRIELYRKELEKLMNTRITIYCEEEAKQRDVEISDFNFKDQPLLDLEETKITVKKKAEDEQREVVKYKYRIKNTPVLYRYSEINNQVNSIPMDIFCANPMDRITDRALLIKYYLLHEIDVGKYIARKKYLAENRYKKKDKQPEDQKSEQADKKKGEKSEEENSEQTDKQNSKKPVDQTREGSNISFSISLFTKTVRHDKCDSGLLTEIDWYPEPKSENDDESDDEYVTNKIKKRSSLSEIINTPSGLHTIKDVNNIVKKYLDLFKENGFIKDYEVKLSAKGKVLGYTIIVGVSDRRK